MKKRININEARLSNIIRKSISKVIKETYDRDGYSASEYDAMYDDETPSSEFDHTFELNIGGETLQGTVTFLCNDRGRIVGYKDIEDFEMSEFLDDEMVQMKFEELADEFMEENNSNLD